MFSQLDLVAKPDAVLHRIRSQIRNMVLDHDHNTVHWQAYYQVHLQAYYQVHLQVRRRVQDQVLDQVSNQVLDQ